MVLGWLISTVTGAVTNLISGGSQSRSSASSSKPKATNSRKVSSSKPKATSSRSVSSSKPKATSSSGSFFGISLPTVSLPKVELPKVELPKVSLPDLSGVASTINSVGSSAASVINLPGQAAKIGSSIVSGAVSSVKLPTVTLPKVELPKVNLDSLSSALPKVAINSVLNPAGNVANIGASLTSLSKSVNLPSTLPKVSISDTLSAGASVSNSVLSAAKVVKLPAYSPEIGLPKMDLSSVVNGINNLPGVVAEAGGSAGGGLIDTWDGLIDTRNQYYGDGIARAIAGNTATEKGIGVAQTGAAFAADAALPLDLVNVVEKLSTGQGDKLDGWDYLGAAIDGLAIGVGVFTGGLGYAAIKGGKLALKGGKAGGKAMSLGGGIATGLKTLGKTSNIPTSGFRGILHTAPTLKPIGKTTKQVTNVPVNRVIYRVPTGTTGIKTISGATPTSGEIKAISGATPTSREIKAVSGATPTSGEVKAISGSGSTLKGADEAAAFGSSPGKLSKSNFWTAGKVGAIGAGGLGLGALLFSSLPAFLGGDGSGEEPYYDPYAYDSGYYYDPATGEYLQDPYTEEYWLPGGYTDQQGEYYDQTGEYIPPAWGEGTPYDYVEYPAQEISRSLDDVPILGDILSYARHRGLTFPVMVILGAVIAYGCYYAYKKYYKPKTRKKGHRRRKSTGTTSGRKTGRKTGGKTPN